MLAAVLMVSSCTEDMEYKDVNVSPVSALYEPTDGQKIALEASSTASVYFEWEAAKAEDSGAPLYEVVFYKDAEGEPIYKAVSDRNGALNCATISHKVMNKICEKAGIVGGQSGVIYWSVIASRGLNSVLASVKNSINITSLEGFTEIPSSLKLVGEGLDQACSVPGHGEFEIFAKLEAGKTYIFDGGETKYYIDGTKIKLGDTPSALVSEDGIYRLFLDFNVASLTVRKIEKMSLYWCPGGNTILDLDYVADGVFEGRTTIEFKQEGWGRDQRYKFIMTYADGTQQMWGTKHDTDVAPNGLPEGDAYYEMMETANNQWDQKWKFDDQFDGAKDGHNPGAVSVITASFNNSQYRHFVKLAE